VTRVRLLALVALAAFVAVSGALWWPSGSRNDTSPGQPDIVLITIDTLRADRAGRGLTPAIDAIAGRGARFSNARSPVPLTLPAHVSIMTGLLPSSHGVRENGVVFQPRPDSPTIAAALDAAGYETGAFVGAYVLDRRFGLSHGFDSYDDRVHRNLDVPERLEAERRGSEVTDAALAWLQSARSPYFLWVHLYDPHAPYQAPADAPGSAGSPYDAEVAYADSQVARISAALAARGSEATTVIVVAGDHGEGLGDHGEQTHGMLAYDTTLRVPLVMAGPGVGRVTVDRPVSSVDIAPTLQRRAALTPAAATDGVDLLSPLPAERDVYAETQYPRAAGWHPLAVLAGGRWKLVLSSEAELYDIAADPGERANVAAAQPGVVKGMTTRVRQIESRAVPSGSKIDAEAAARLRALGYVSGGDAPVDSRAPNPAREIAAWNAFESALSALARSEVGPVLPALRDLAARFPTSRTFQSTYARALLDSGNARGAFELLRTTVSRHPRDAALYHDLSAAARAAGVPAEALRAEQAALALDPNSAAALNGLGLLHADGGRAAAAAAAFERAAAIDRANASYWANLGNARRELGDLAAANEAYRRALEQDESYPDALNGLAVVFVQTGSPGGAVPLLTKALARAPDFHEARLNLGIAHQQSGDRDRAAETYREVLARAPAAAKRERQAAAALLNQVR
jgi:choline-sulfatase